VARQKLSNTEIAKRKREGRYHDGRRPLTAKIVQGLKYEGRYKDGLMPGLYLQVSTTGTKSWLLRYELNGQPERWMGLGSAAIFSLAEARARARVARQQLSDGIDPLQAKRDAKAASMLAAAKKLTFREAAKRYAAQHEAKWTNAEYRAQFMSSLHVYAFPIIGDLDVSIVDKAAVLRVLEPIWATKTVTASRVRRRIEAVLNWAVVHDHRPPGDNPARWRGHLDQALPARQQITPVAHLKALPYSELPGFMMELRARKSNAARALEFTILTAARTNEVLGARWSEIDFDNETWTVPPSRMKAGKEHRVPLASAAIALLRALPHERDNDHIFIGPAAGRRFSDMAMARVLKCISRGATVHGFRSTFSYWAHEQTAHASHAIEISLAHSVGNEVEKAYRRGDLFDKRRRLMEAWAKFALAAPIKQEGDRKLVRYGRADDDCIPL
jgi:integrase